MIKYKPLGVRSYGSIPHLSGSRLGPSDKKANKGQEIIATVEQRDRHDLIVVQEKLDGSNVGVCKINGKIKAITRAGYLATSSPYEQHHVFDEWVAKNIDRFSKILDDGDRICGEWMYQAHGTIYDLNTEPFIAFDVFRGGKRLCFDDMQALVSGLFVLPKLLHKGASISISDIDQLLGVYGHHGATTAAEGAVWRVERKGSVDFLCKYVRPGKVDGAYLTGDPVINKYAGG